MPEGWERELARVVGLGVRQIRQDRGWTQRDLAAELSRSDPSWTPKRVGVLESDGVRADRLAYIAQLCEALNCGLDDLIAGSASFSLGETRKDLEWLRSVLGSSGPRQLLDGRIALERLGADDAQEVAKLAERAQMGARQFEGWVAKTWPGMTPMQVRDALAEINTETTPREAQAKRGHASRRLVAMAKSGGVEPRDVELVKTMWAQISFHLRSVKGTGPAEKEPARGDD